MGKGFCWEEDKDERTKVPLVAEAREEREGHEG
jgi:hypothetical protein